MNAPRRLKHMPEAQWPADDRRLFEAAFAPGDVFDEDGGLGAHLAAATQQTIRSGWQRWLGYLAAEDPAALQLRAADRITQKRIRAYVEHLEGESASSSIAMAVSNVHYAARLIAPDRDWSWLKALKRRFHAAAVPQDRFERLVPAERTLDLGITLMETADSLPATRRREREIHYRDGLIIAILSLWPIRRRSLAAPTLDRHVEVADDCINLCLFPADTKAQRAESWSVPELLLPFLERYLAEIRPSLLGRKSHDALWVGRRGDPLQAGGIYAAVRRRTAAAFGKLMALHDFRRAAATFLAITAPEQVGLIPGILQHASPEVSDRYYNLSRGAMASRRYNAAVAELKARMSQSMR